MEMERDYVFGPGLLLKTELEFQHPVWGSFILEYSHWNIFSANKLRGSEHLDKINLRKTIPIWQGLETGADYYYLRCLSNYKDAADLEHYTERVAHELRIFLSYKF